MFNLEYCKKAQLPPYLDWKVGNMTLPQFTAIRVPNATSHQTFTEKVITVLLFIGLPLLQTAGKSLKHHSRERGDNSSALKNQSRVRAGTGGYLIHRDKQLSWCLSTHSWSTATQTHSDDDWEFN